MSTNHPSSLSPTMVTIHVEDEDLWYHLPTFHATVGPLLLTNEASHEDMVKHKTEFTEAAHAIKRIAAPFIHTRCVEVMDGLPDHFRLAGYIPDFRVAENIIFDAFSITIMFIVRMGEITGKPTIQLKLLPEEFLGHLITTDEGDGKVRLDRGPLDAFDQNQPVVLFKDTLHYKSDLTNHNKSLTYECAVDEFDSTQQALVTKIIRNTLAPLTHITECVLDLSDRKDDFIQRNTMHTLMKLVKRSTPPQDILFPAARHQGRRREFHRMTRAIFELISSFESENVKIECFAPDQLSLVIQYTGGAATDPSNDHIINLTLAVINRSTVELTMRPAELLSHLTISELVTDKGTVLLHNGPLDAFPTDQPCAMRVENESISQGDHVYHFKSWKYECNMHRKDPDRRAQVFGPEEQILVKKIIRNAIAPFVGSTNFVHTHTALNMRHAKHVKAILNTLQLPKHIQGPYPCAKSA